MTRINLLNVLFICILAVFIASCQKKKQSFTPEWSKGIIWYQIFPDRFNNGDPDNDPKLKEQFGAWPHDTINEWMVHPWNSDWYEILRYENENGKDIWYNITRRRYGGDLQGIINKLDYIKDLGVGAIYLNPVFVSPSHHKYDIAYHHHIDPVFGPDPEKDWEIIAREDHADYDNWPWTSADSLMLKLIQEAHKREIKIIFDGVFNHFGYDHFAFQDVLKNQEESDYKDWFTIYSFRDSSKNTEFKYEGWWGVATMPEILETEAGFADGPREYINAVTKRWMDPDKDGKPSDGIDGWRLDVAFEVGHEAWKKWRKVVKGINPEAYLTAEVIDKPDVLRPYLLGDEFDAAMNYNFTFILSDYFINDSLSISTKEFDSLLSELRNAFPPEVNDQMQNLMGSHDTHRFSSRIVNSDVTSFRNIPHFFDKTKAKSNGFKTRKPNKEEYQLQKLMAVFQFTYPGSPMIYYGDEVGMWGAGDPGCRKPMIWEEITYLQETYEYDGSMKVVIDSVKPDLDLYHQYSKLGKIRNKFEVFRKGDYKTIIAEDGIFCFQRKLDDQSVVVIFNKDKDIRSIDLSFMAKGIYTDVLNDKHISINEDMIIQIEPSSAIILITVKR